MTRQKITYRVSGGRVHHSHDNSVTYRLELSDEYSGVRLVELEFTAEEFLSLANSAYFEKVGGFADPLTLGRVNHKMVHDAINVPADVYGNLYGDAADKAIKDWYEDQDGSGEVDGYAVKKLSYPESGYRIDTWIWVPRAEYEAQVRLTEESEEPDMDDDGLDDDDVEWLSR